MTYILFFLIILSFYYLFTSYVNKYCWYFLGIIWSLVAAMYSVFLLISMTGNYLSIGYVFADWDKQIFLSIIKNRNNLFHTIRLFNISTVTYLVILRFFSVSYFKLRNKLNTVLNIFFVIFPVSYLIFYDSDVIYRMYCFVETSGSQSVFSFICGIDLFMHITMYMVLFLPIVYLILQKKRGEFSSYKKQQLWGVSAFVFLSNILYLCILRLSSIRQIYLGKEPQFLIAVRTYGAIFKREYLIYPLIMAIAIIVMLITSYRFHLIRSEGVFSKLLTKRHFKVINKNLTGTFHSVKNIIFSYALALDDARCAEPDEQKELLNNLSVNMHNYIEHLSLMLNSNNSFGDFFAEEHYVSYILEDTLYDFKCPKNIKIIKNYSSNTEKVQADILYMKEALLNILQNASEAIQAKGCDGSITISIFREFDLVVIIIADTGCGMDRKTVRNIFKPFYTKKSRIENWGIGLSFVNKIIKMHNGNISVKSNTKQGTSFTIILPLA